VVVSTESNLFTGTASVSAREHLCTKNTRTQINNVLVLFAALC